MTAKQVRIRRGTSADIAAMTPASSELLHNTTTNRLHIGNGVRAGGYETPNFSDIQKQAFGFATAGGTGNAITLSLSPALLSYSAGVAVEFLATANNTGAVTVNANGLGAVTVLKMKEGVLSQLEEDDIISGSMYRIVCNGSQFQIFSLSEDGGGTKGWELLAIATGGGGSYNFTSGINSTYANYAFVIRGWVPSTAGTNLYIRTRRAGQGSFDSGADYISTVEPGNRAFITLCPFSPGVSHAGGVFGMVTAHGIGSAGRHGFVWDIFYESNPNMRVEGGGRYNTSSAIDGVQFFSSNGSIASGTIYMYGMKSAL